MIDLHIQSARELLLKQQLQFDDWCKRFRSDALRLSKLQHELVSMRRNRSNVGYQQATDLQSLLTRCRRTRATRNHSAAVIEIYRIRCQQLLNITGIPQTLASRE